MIRGTSIPPQLDQQKKNTNFGVHKFVSCILCSISYQKLQNSDVLFGNISIVIPLRTSQFSQVDL